ncbi:MAG: hypothetical protein FWH33_04480 [Oscillospiraceae bacterium]|nr:hypothetical protein [Oscillospiraceae bacterium]
MASFIKVNNERSEAIELIKVLDSVVKKNTWQIKSIGGESTLNTGNERMFPDVILYGDQERTHILHGWEVKMPNVSITDSAFIYDAQRKAETIGVNSCIVWNFASCSLYIKGENGWNKTKSWSDAGRIRSRSDVGTFRSDWEAMATTVLCDTNDYFLSGELRHARIGDIVADTVYAELIKRNKSITAEHIRDVSITNRVVAAHVSSWWRNVEKEYKFDENDRFSAYAKCILLNWINKITFANLIKGNHNPAALVESINNDMTPAEAQIVFSEITAQCDFFNVFEAIEYSHVLPAAAWNDLTDYNAFLYDNGLAYIPQTAMQAVLEMSVNQFKRNVSGVFTTPQKLARILVNAAIDDLTSFAIDPCCGTGTIAKEILIAKEAAIGVESAFSTTYASDKSSFALQISNITLTRANAINLPCMLFRANVFDLREGNEIEITNPLNGAFLRYKLPKWGSIISNLPFVSFDQEGREEGAFIESIIARVCTECDITLSGRIDLYQAMLFYLHELAEDNASVAVITSNSWLGTLAGQDFFRALNCYYSIDSIIASGNGKWFSNVDVVTIMLFLKNKSTPCSPSTKHTLSFGLMNKPLQALSDVDSEQMADSIKLKQTLSPKLLSFRTYSLETIDNLLNMGIALNSFFYNPEWLFEINELLCPIAKYFNVFRGMKTGQDEIYYLRDGSEVNDDYIGRVLKSARSVQYLNAVPDTFSFVCNKSIEELTVLGHKRTLDWIERFKGHINQSVPHKDTFWMNLSDGAISGSDRIRLFTGMNPERRIFYGLLSEPAQINQRAIGFVPVTDSISLELCHALLNSVIGVFYVEASGFPKGLGALDTNSENIGRTMMLDPCLLSEDAAGSILTAFRRLASRRVMSTEKEYLQSDRLSFESIVADHFGYTSYFEQIKECVLNMQKVRLSVRSL